jgi:prepilin-type N-terminal cleavage/methylation domain-containing protein
MPPTTRTLKERRRDAGFTLPELLISVMLTGILATTMAGAFSIVLSQQKPTIDRLAESKDITFVQTWVPLDISSAVASTDPNVPTINDAPDADPTLAKQLPGTNVLTVLRADLTAGSEVRYYVSYRYLQVRDEWRIVRYEIRNAGTASEVVKEVGVAHQMPAPPPGWRAGIDKPTHAVEINARNQVILRPIGDDIQVNFKSGNNFSTGGAPLSRGLSLSNDSLYSQTDPKAPPSRCGASIAIVLDTSGSVPQSGGGEQAKTAAASFIDAFKGTPSQIATYGFDASAYRMYPANDTQPYASLLNDQSPEIAAARKRFTDLDNRDNNWNQSNPDAPTFDGIHWDQKGTGTNWEDGLFLPFRTDAGALRADTPELVVFITDGQPNKSRPGSSTNHVDNALKMAQADKKTGARVVGVIVGDEAKATNWNNYGTPTMTAKANGPLNLAKVVGPRVWDGSATVNTTTGAVTVVPGNAANADLFYGSFANLGGVLRSIMIAECGGTVTIQKKMSVDGTLTNLTDVPSTSVWTYTSEIGTRDLVRSATASITMDFPLGSATSKEVSITESGALTNTEYVGATCRSEGAPYPIKAVDLATQTITLDVRADSAINCTMISKAK